MTTTHNRFKAKNGLDNNSKTIVNVATPVNATDAVNKTYADLKAPIDNPTFTTNVTLGTTAKIFFTSNLGQKLNLWSSAGNDAYGIGIQPSTMYYRTAGIHAFYHGGSHSDSTAVPGAGGILSLMLDSSGHFIFGGSTGIPTTQTKGFAINYSNGSIVSGVTGGPNYFGRTDANGELLAFGNTANQRVGTIVTSASTTTYQTTSDYRLKNITGTITDSGAFIDALQPRVGTWKIDGSPFVGFIAHEFAEVSPSSVYGIKDAVEESGEPIYQSMQASSPEVMANVIAELQALRKRNADLESELAAIKAHLGI